MAQTISDGVLHGATDAINTERLKHAEMLISMLDSEERDMFDGMFMVVYRMNKNSYSINPLAVFVSTLKVGEGEVALSALEETSGMIHMTASRMVSEAYDLSDQYDIDNQIIKDVANLVKNGSITNVKPHYQQNLFHGMIGAFKTSYPQDIMFNSEKRIVFIDRDLSEWV